MSILVSSEGYLGDLPALQILYFTFATSDNTGAGSTLAGSPVVSVYKDDDLAQSTAGITLVPDFDGKTGLNSVKIDTSSDAFYASEHDFSVVLTTGTVGIINVAGAVLALFSLDNRKQIIGSVEGDVEGDVFGDVQGKVLGGGAGVLSGVGVQADVEQWKAQVITTPEITGVPHVDVTYSGGIAVTEGDFSASINTIAARLGALTGTGTNTVLGFFQALLRDDTTLPSDIGGTYSNATMSLEALFTDRFQHLPEGLIRAQAYPNFNFILRSSSNHAIPITGRTVTAQRSIDGGSFGACTNAVVEVANGAYRITLSSSDLDGVSILLLFTASGADAAFFVLKTV